MRYWYLDLVVQHGEYEFHCKSVHSQKNEFDAEEYASDFYGMPDENYGDGCYLFNCGAVAVQVYEVKEITKAEYEVLKKYIG